MTVDQYINSIADDKKDAFIKLQHTIKNNLPVGFEERIIYNMVGYVVPFETYPDGYHCDTTLPLPFINIAAQKNFISLYHMGIYAQPEVLNWFTTEYPKHAKSKLDIGKSCIRFKKMTDIPFDLIAELMTKISPEQWIKIYTDTFKK